MAAKGRGEAGRDPQRVPARNTAMFDAATIHLHGGTAPPTVRAPREGYARADVTDGAEQGRPTWAEEMARIAAARDARAFDALFAHFAPRVKAFLMKGGAPEPVAEDCAQDVMATVWRKAEMFDASRASVATWIFTIARNRRIDLARRERRPEPEDLPWGPEAEPDPEGALAVEEEGRILASAVAALPPAQRDLVQRAFWGDLSHSEIAAETGLPLGTIKSRIRLALQRLRGQMEPKE